MGGEAAEGKGQRLRFECGVHASIADLTAQLSETIAREISCDEVVVQLRHHDELFIGRYPRATGRHGSVDDALFELTESGPALQGNPWPLPLVIHDLQRARLPSELALELSVRKVRSCGVFPVISRGHVVGIIECYYTRSYHRWRQEELSAFDDLGGTLSTLLAGSAKEAAPVRRAPSEELRNQYRRMARYGNIVIIITDENFGITDVHGNTEQLLGIAASEMMSDPAIWDRILDPRERGPLRRRIMRLRSERNELREEMRFIHQRTGEVRWIMLRAHPQFSSNGVFLGWEGFGIDVTDRRRAQEALVTQNRRLEALFEVSRALQGHTDPAMVSLRGLRALIRATSSECGYACILERDKSELELVATQGLSERYIDSIGPVLTGPSLLRFAIDQREGMLIENLQEDPHANVPLAKLENLKSTIIMPLTADGEVYGAIVLFKHEAKSYSEADFDLVSAAAVQITMAVRQAAMFETERRHSEALGALYRISHELSKHRTPREIAEHAFPVLQQEFALKRCWFGVLNEQGTHIVGKSGFGAGVRRQLQEIQVELNTRHDFLDEAIRTQSPVVVGPEQRLECSGLNRVIERLKLDTFVVIPLVSLGQVVGVLIVEPIVPTTFLRDGRLQLLASMANEMATVLMARRFETKMAEALKMRMAGLLASGVAHNFNNLLQAVLGQVSLIEMQIPKDSPALEATRTITEAARRGAALVAQLLNFAAHGRASKESIHLDSLLNDSQDLYRSLLGREIELHIEEPDECPDVVADGSQVQQIITNLLANAKDAIGDKADGKVTLSLRRVRLRSGEIDPDLAPGFYMRLDVRDNGAGMDAEQQARCFEPFFTTKNVDRDTGVGLAGSGLGLSAAYSIAKQHEGVITVHSAESGGAIFSLYLPVRSAKANQTTQGAEQISPHVDRPGVILLGIEPGVQPFLQSIFDSLGYTSRIVFDLHQAHEVLRREHTQWSIITLDLDILGPDSGAVCSQLLQQYPELNIMAAASSPKEWVERLVPYERIAVLDKPLGVWSVDAALEKFAADGSSGAGSHLKARAAEDHNGNGHGGSGNGSGNGHHSSQLSERDVKRRESRDNRQAEHGA